MDKCPVCHEDTRQTLTFAGMTMDVKIACACRRAELDAERAQEQDRQTADHKHYLRRKCFGSSYLRECTFDRDDEKMPKVSAAMRRYVENWKQMKADNMGILLHGSVGSGKTFYAACIANALIDKGVGAIVTNFSDVVNELQSTFSGRQDILDELANVPLLVLDDLGIERDTGYMHEQIYNIIDARYRSRKPLIVTTNIPMDQIVNAKKLEYERVFDRVLEMCHPVEIIGSSRRWKKVNADYARKSESLGL